MNLTRLTPLLALGLAALPVFAQSDWRNIREGHEIPTESYADQPYVVKTNDGAWLVCLTTGAGREGQPGQHIITMRSTDQGRTWSKPVDVEPPSLPESSYAVLLKVPSGRVYVFYNHNTDNIRQVIGDRPAYKDGFVRRVDSLGHFVFKYSDDNGNTWSAERYEIPMRDFEIDRKNPYGGKIKFFWNVGKAFMHRGAGYVPLIKVGGFGEGFFTSNEGVLLRSENILTERDPKKLKWETLPEGDIGIRTPPGGGPIAAEESYSVLSDGSIFCVYRTIDGYSAFTYSRDDGRSWETPQYMRYDDGRLMKHPRAATFAWRCENGKFLYWFHNHGGRFIAEHPQRRSMAYNDRNPVWLVGGIETDSPKGKIIRWSQPEIALYDDDPIIRMSYPDLVEEPGKYFLTETQKDIARTHEVKSELLEGMWSQFDTNPQLVTDGLLLSLPAAQQTMPDSAPAPQFPLFNRRSNRADHGTEDLRAGFSVDLRVAFGKLSESQVILDNRLPDGRGLTLAATPRGSVEVLLNDGRTQNRWETEPGLIQANKTHSIALIVDGGPKIISFVVDGKFCDGANHQQFGWGRFSPYFQSVNGDKTLLVGPKLDGKVEQLRIYGRAITVSEAVNNHRAMN